MTIAPIQPLDRTDEADDEDAESPIDEREERRVNRELHGLSGPALIALYLLLRRAGRRTSAGLRRLAREQRGDTPVTLGVLARARQLLAPATDLLRTAGTVFGRGLAVQSTRARTLSGEHLRRWYSGIDRTLSRGSQTGAQRGGTQGPRSQQPSLSERVRGLLQRYAEDCQRAVTRALTQAMIARETISAMVSRIAALDPRARGNVFDRAGAAITRRMRTDAERIAETEVHREYSTEMLELVRALERVGVPVKRRWNATGDNICPRCWDLHGTEAKGSEPFAGGYTSPPIHPRCKCWVEIILPPAVTRTHENQVLLSADETERARAEILLQTGLGVWLDRMSITFDTRWTEPIEYYEEGVLQWSAYAMWDYDANMILLSRTTTSGGEDFVAWGTRLAANAAPTPIGAYQRIIVHEIGHALIDKGPARVRGRLRTLWHKHRAERTYFTAYGDKNEHELGAELITGYFFQRAELLEWDPEAIPIVEELLRFHGILPTK